LYHHANLSRDRAGRVTFFRPILAGATLSERTVACAGAFVAVALTAAAGFALSLHAPLLAAPIGASAVLVFAVPASPMAQPWPVIGGNTISAFVGLGVAWTIPDATIAAACAVALAIAVMSLTRCLHPPGGAVALTVALGSPVVAKWGALFPLVPVGLNSLSLVALGIAFHALSRRSYPHRGDAAAPAAPARDKPEAAFSPSDIDEALTQMGETLDISRSDLDRLLHYAENNAARRQARPS
jgi:CBS domain-containing membrane protein